MTNEKAIELLEQALARISETAVGQAMEHSVAALRVLGPLRPQELVGELRRLRHVAAVFEAWYPASFAEAEGWSEEVEDAVATVSSSDG